MTETPNRTFSREEIDTLRAHMEAYRNETTPPRTWKRLAQDTGANEKSIAAWVPGTYDNGEYWKNQVIPDLVERFLRSRQERAQLTARVPAIPGFHATTTSGRMMSVCSVAIAFGGMGMISTAPGCGKTWAAKEFQKTRSNVFMTTLSKGCGAPNDILTGLLESMGEVGQKGVIGHLKKRVIERMSGINGGLLVDEAQFGTASGLEELRAIHDATGCGVVLIGDERLPGVLKGHPQLHSRLVVSHAGQKLPEADDVDTLAAAWSINNPALVDYLRTTAAKLSVGGLRRITHGIRLAVMGATAEGRELTVQDLKDGLAQRFMEGA
ncbi:AAA family ATPase [Caulobacter sp. SLTY]|uniref:AAA family ATPase n=1 Tax=Caulobacter sp. SLTY TaxID=2683262 RepID=UPI001411B5FD|nr:AAA family ATPase [Caulobacter sp. SLTY]NBB17010.1 AAA family ATPase [Caulobacter sp. SLTY]